MGSLNQSVSLCNYHTSASYNCFTCSQHLRLFAFKNGSLAIRTGLHLHIFSLCFSILEIHYYFALILLLQSRSPLRWVRVPGIHHLEIHNLPVSKHNANTTKSRPKETLAFLGVPLDSDLCCTKMRKLFLCLPRKSPFPVFVSSTYPCYT